MAEFPRHPPSGEGRQRSRTSRQVRCAGMRVRHGGAANALPAHRLTGVVESVFIDVINVVSIVGILSLFQDLSTEES
jgi:hypothetical protein